MYTIENIFYIQPNLIIFYVKSVSKQDSNAINAIFSLEKWIFCENTFFRLALFIFISII